MTRYNFLGNSNLKTKGYSCDNQCVKAEMHQFPTSNETLYFQLSDEDFLSSTSPSLPSIPSGRPKGCIRGAVVPCRGLYGPQTVPSGAGGHRTMPQLQPLCRGRSLEQLHHTAVMHGSGTGGACSRT